MLKFFSIKRLTGFDEAAGIGIEGGSGWHVKILCAK
jgi:hypothetical protein